MDPDRAILVIFGAALRPGGRPSPVLLARIKAGLELGKRLDSPLYLPTGGQGPEGPPEAEAMRRALREAGVKDEDILPEPTARDTLESVVAVRRLLGKHRGPVHAVTSGFHLPRCVVLLRLAGFDAHAAPPPPAPARRRWWWRMREVPALPYDAALLIARRLFGKV
ncbi:YdcF family protein [Acetobacteraceae bacterium H6797]|nr:YdcF family protein [Acetobacteraceae bacterium H6797]